MYVRSRTDCMLVYVYCLPTCMYKPFFVFASELFEIKYREFQLSFFLQAVCRTAIPFDRAYCSFYPTAVVPHEKDVHTQTA